MKFHGMGFSPECRLLVLLGIACAVATAQVVSYPTFASTAGLSLQGSAAAIQTNDGIVLRLTKPVTWQAGSAFTAGTVPFQIPGDTFSTFFQFRITNPGGINPADGIVFVIREVGTPALGQGGGAQGYDGISHSIGIKFDTYQNEKEPNDNHVAVQTNGVWLDEFTQTPGGVANCTKPLGVAGCMSNGDLWSVWIDYDGGNIHVAVADGSTKRPADLIYAPLSVPVVLNYATDVFVGFTAATGSGFENHDIVNWQYFSMYYPTPVGSEQQLPSTLISPPTGSAAQVRPAR